MSCIKTRQCRKCNTARPPECFASSHLNSICLSCQAVSRTARSERQRAYDRKRHAENGPAERARHRDYYRKDPDHHRKRRSDYYQANRTLELARDQARDSVKLLARTTLTNAVRAGKVSKPSRCQFCDVSFPLDKIHGHHPDYSKPLQVMWLCKDCHAKVHRKDYYATIAGV